MSEIPSKARLILKKRDGGQCRRCGGVGTEVHHRQRRREAGHAVGILVTLCRKDHTWAHSHPTDAKAAGYIIPPWEVDACAVPIRTFQGWMTFDNDGGVEFVDHNTL